MGTKWKVANYLSAKSGKYVAWIMPVDALDSQRYKGLRPADVLMVLGSDGIKEVAEQSLAMLAATSPPPPPPVSVGDMYFVNVDGSTLPGVHPMDHAIKLASTSAVLVCKVGGSEWEKVAQPEASLAEEIKATRKSKEKVGS